MTHKHRPSSSESGSRYAATAHKHRRRVPRQKVVIEEEEDHDNGDEGAFDSEYNDESQGDEYEEETEEEDNDDDDNDVSESLSNALSFSQEAQCNNIPESDPSISTSNIPPQPIKNASSSYINIAPLPIFHGTQSESAITHLSRFNKVCRANNASSIDMQKKIFPITLEEEPALWYDLNIEPYYTSLSWEEIKLSFLQAYYEMETVEELKSELKKIHQGEKESVRSYFLRLQWILKRWPEHGLHDDVIKGVFVDGLREEFHEWIMIQKPNSLNEALKLAFGFEKVRSISGKKEMVVTCGFCEGMHEEDNCGVREGMRELWRKGVKNEESDHKESKDLVRLFSIGESSGQGKIKIIEGGKGEETVVGGSMSKNQCQCTRHQCWKKTLSRNSSLDSRISLHDG